MKKSKYPKFKFNWMGALILIAGMFAAAMLIAGINVFSMFVFHENLQYSDGFIMISNALSFVTAIAFFDFFIVRPTTRMKLNFNFGTTNFYTYLLVFPMMLGMMFMGEFVTSQIPTTGPVFGDLYEWFTLLMGQLTKDPVMMIIMAVIMAPIFEEIIFRGIIQKGLINNGMRPAYAIIIASVVFGLVHANPWQFVGAVMLGCVMGLVYEKTKTLLLPILLHAFNNLCSSILIFYTDNESFAEAFKVSEWLILGIGIVLFTVFYYLFTKKNNVHYSEN